MSKLTWLIEAFVAYKLIVFGLALVGLMTVAGVAPESFSHFCSLMYEWDAKHILRVAREGYLAAEPSIQVYPVTPLLIRVFQLVLRNWEVAGLAATQVCSFVAFYFFYRLARLELDAKLAKLALALFAFFPTAYFLSVPYSEAAYCAASFAAVYFIRVERFGPAAGLAFVASLTRVNGLLLAPAVVVHAWVHRGRWTRRQLAGLSSIAAACGVGYLCYLGLNQYLYGNWFHYVADQQKHWGVHPSWPGAGALEAIKLWSTRNAGDQMSTIVMELGFMFGAVALTPWLFRRERAFDLTYVALNLLMLLSLNFWLSRPRYVLVLYPLFLEAAPRLARRPVALALWALVSISLFGIYWALYLSARWAH